MAEHNWIDLAQDAETGIETIRAHFEGHAYDLHWHDSYLIGFTEQGTQQFNCRRNRHDSTPGLVFTLNPGELHDGTAPAPGGFTYSALYLEPRWLERELHALFEETPGNRQLEFPATLTDDPALVLAIAGAFRMLSWQEMRIVRQTALDELLRRLVGHLRWTPRLDPDPGRLPVAEEMIGLVGAAGLQIVNPKVWMMALAVVGVFAGSGADQYRHVFLLALVFFLIALPCMSVWAVLGHGIARLCRSPRRMRWFNRTMALLLQLSAWSTLLV